MRPVSRKITVNHGDTVMITHLGSKSPVDVWMSESLTSFPTACMLMVCGRTGPDGFLPVTIKINGQKLYPTNELGALLPLTSVSFEIKNVLVQDIHEKFDCDQRSIDRVQYGRYRRALVFASAESEIVRLNGLMATIATKWNGRP